jgi:hypothetical protein
LMNGREEDEEDGDDWETLKLKRLRKELEE